MLLPAWLAVVQPSARDLVNTTFDARVTRVADGDSLEITRAGDRRPIRVRLEAIDAPELDEVFGREAATFARGLLGNRHVRVAGRDVDTYGRLVARLTVGGKDASTEIVRAGMACYAYVPDRTMAEVQSRAQAARAGFWAATGRKPRCTDRRPPRARRR